MSAPLLYLFAAFTPCMNPPVAPRAALPDSLPAVFATHLQRAQRAHHPAALCRMYRKWLVANGSTGLYARAQARSVRYAPPADPGARRNGCRLRPPAKPAGVTARVTGQKRHQRGTLHPSGVCRLHRLPRQDSGLLVLLPLRHHERVLDRRGPGMGALAQGASSRCLYGARLSQLRVLPQRRRALSDGVGKLRRVPLRGLLRWSRA